MSNIRDIIDDICYSHDLTANMFDTSKSNVVTLKLHEPDITVEIYYSGHSVTASTTIDDAVIAKLTGGLEIDEMMQMLTLISDNMTLAVEVVNDFRYYIQISEVDDL